MVKYVDDHALLDALFNTRFVVALGYKLPLSLEHCSQCRILAYQSKKRVGSKIVLLELGRNCIRRNGFQVLDQREHADLHHGGQAADAGA